MTHDSPADRAARGADLLDHAQPTWFLAIDAATLDLWTTTECVCGQVFGDYTDGLSDLHEMGWNEPFVSPRQYGFDPRDRPDADELRTAWLAEVHTRLAKPIPPIRRPA